MRFLLDTHALIWWLEDAPRLGPVAKALIADSANETLTSVVSLWEITVKWRVGKLAKSGSYFGALLCEQQIELLSISADDIRALEELPLHHSDPFDHLILAQAQQAKLTLITSDRQMSAYGIPCIDASR